MLWLFGSASQSGLRGRMPKRELDPVIRTDPDPAARICRWRDMMGGVLDVFEHIVDTFDALVTALAVQQFEFRASGYHPPFRPR